MEEKEVILEIEKKPNVGALKEESVDDVIKTIHIGEKNGSNR